MCIFSVTAFGSQQSYDVLSVFFFELLLIKNHRTSCTSGLMFFIYLGKFSPCVFKYCFCFIFSPLSGTPNYLDVRLSHCSSYILHAFLYFPFFFFFQFFSIFFLSFSMDIFTNQSYILLILFLICC